MKRRLAAILAADIAGYSRLMEADEEATLERLKAYRDAIDALIDDHDGRVFGSAGDSVIAEFASPVEAVRCAAAIQAETGERNAALPEDRRMRFRIGVHLGDVMAEDDDLFGDGVNLAARLEGLAEPGGICISEAVHTHVHKTLDLNYESLGKQRLKNIAEDVTVYRVRLEAATRPDGSGSVRPVWRKSAVLAAVAAVFVIATLAVRVLNFWPASDGVVATDAPVETVSTRPSIAVLPFVNLSGDDDQEYFADGMTEDLITDLSKISTLNVISRTSTSGYKGRTIDIREVGKSLGVRYVIEGSVRKAGDRVRINAQLVDAASGSHLWADRYDGAMNDIFSLQDKVLAQIVDSLALTLSQQERQRLAARGTKSVAAHDLYLRGLFQESAFTRDAYHKAMTIYQQALAIDPDYALPYARMANILELSARNGWSDDVEADLKRAVALAEKAVALDPQNPQVHWSLGRAIARLRTPAALKRSIAAMERAIELDPDFADAYAFLTVLYIADGRGEDGLRSIATAMRLNPRYPFWYLHMRGMGRYVTKDYKGAIADFEAAAEKSPTALFVHWWLAASYAQAGRIDDAKWQVDEMQVMGFTGSITTIVETQPIQDPGYLKIYMAGLRKAGIPE